MLNELVSILEWQEISFSCFVHDFFQTTQLMQTPRL